MHVICISVVAWAPYFDQLKQKLLQNLTSLVSVRKCQMFLEGERRDSEESRKSLKRQIVFLSERLQGIRLASLRSNPYSLHFLLFVFPISFKGFISPKLIKREFYSFVYELKRK